MPTTYTHDAFGRKIYHRLPENLKRVICDHIQLYRIGLHGPDILFYHSLRKNKINQTGVRLHEEIARPFFQRGIERARADQDDALLAYLLGFACHFMLDSTCHPYIYSVEGEISHTLIEKELDRRCMERDGLNPLHYFPARGIIPSRKNGEVIHKMFPEISVQEIRRSLRGMRRLTGLMVYGSGWRRKGITAVLKAAGKEEEFSDFFMTRESSPAHNGYLDELDILFRRALKETPGVLAALYTSMTGEIPLPIRFDRDYQ